MSGVFRQFKLSMRKVSKLSFSYKCRFFRGSIVTVTATVTLHGKYALWLILNNLQLLNLVIYFPGLLILSFLAFIGQSFEYRTLKMAWNQSSAIITWAIFLQTYILAISNNGIIDCPTLPSSLLHSLKGCFFQFPYPTSFQSKTSSPYVYSHRTSTL